MLQIQLKFLREKYNYSQAKLAKLLNVSQSTVGMWESGKNKPEHNTLLKIAELFNVSVDYLLGNSETPKTAEFDIFSIPGIMPIPKTKKVPRLGTIACGTPILAVENIETYDFVDENLHCDFTLECKGDSMAPRMQDGDIVLIRIQPNVENGEIAAVLIDDTATLKHVHYNSEAGILQLLSDNPVYPPQIYMNTELNNIKIIGKAVGFVRYI